METMPRSIREEDIEGAVHLDRWSKDLIESGLGGFSLGVAQYFVREFGITQVHDDQEALYIVSGVGEIRLDEEIIPVGPGTAIYVPPGCKHAARITGPEPLKVVYAHSATS